jgi:hypothetical protein
LCATLFLILFFFGGGYQLNRSNLLTLTFATQVPFGFANGILAAVGRFKPASAMVLFSRRVLLSFYFSYGHYHSIYSMSMGS